MTNTPFVEACGRGDLEEVKATLHKNLYNYEEGLMEACYYDRMEVIKYMTGISVSGVDGIDKTSIERHIISMESRIGNHCSTEVIVHFIQNFRLSLYTISNALFQHKAKRSDVITIIKHAVESTYRDYYYVYKNYLTLEITRKLLNMGVDYKKLGNMGELLTIARDKRKKIISDGLLKNTKIHKDLIELICNYSRY